MLRYVRLFRNLSNWWLHFTVKLGLSRRDPLLFRTRTRVLVEVPIRLYHEFKEIFLEECYTRSLGIRVPDRPVVIDLGANVGFFSLFAASRFPGARIYAYEPVGANFRQLARNVGLNGTHPILCFEKAVYGRPGEISLSLDADDGFTTSATIYGETPSPRRAVRFPCITLPGVFEENSLDRCDLLKMDCEGSEYSILYHTPGEVLRRIAQMAVEVHEGARADHNMGSLTEFLHSHGFKTRCEGYILWAWLPGRKTRPYA